MYDFFCKHCGELFECETKEQRNEFMKAHKRPAYLSASCLVVKTKNGTLARPKIAAMIDSGA